MSVIHVAYAFSPKHGYRARAYVGEYRKPAHSVVVALGDTAAEAMAQCIDYIYAMHDRDKVPPPAKVQSYGKVAGITLDHLAF